MSLMKDTPAKRAVEQIADDLDQRVRSCRNLARYTETHDPVEARALRACANALADAISPVRLAGYKSIERDGEA
ncbi:hypothetical protein [Modicisalibacter sp. MOD 31.J]|uniref:hypothetical protein n=1 Tax=Modicisalibacter sp. MOD 31.J TaxID=2831897 RepID=UPI001CD0166B|nr:hypothetical protein [Modicisalibacter sp. MOD 31.J]MBZ9576756.1 hypothetical protein [Modicisalibacter sp. MOD 31.J]